jgi:hypothetical protein
MELAVVACPARDGISQVVAIRRGDSVSIETGRRNASTALASALAVALLDRDDLRRGGWIAWGELLPDGSVRPVRDLPNDLPSGPCAGQIWHPEDRLPALEDDAVITVGQVSTLREAIEAFEFFAAVEDCIGDLEQIVLRRKPSVLPSRAPGTREMSTQQQRRLEHPQDPPVDH